MLNRSFRWDIPLDIEARQMLSFLCRVFPWVWGWRNCCDGKLLKFVQEIIFCYFLPFLARRWVYLESHGCCNESVIFFIVDIVHFEWSSVFNVSIASQFNTIGEAAVGECRILKGDASSEFAIEKANFWVDSGCRELNCCQKLWIRKIIN